MAKLHLVYAKDFHARLERLGKTSKKGKMAADQCEEILEIIRSEGLCSRNLLRKRTKRGEYRLKNCSKYTLANGYRFITVLREAVLYICFIGTHDEADKWLEQHKSCIFTRETFSTSREEWCGDDSRCQEDEQQSGEPVFIDEYEKRLQARLSDDVLRSVFSGLAK